jgi:hypothetical protein
MVWVLVFVAGAAGTNVYGQIVDTIVPNNYHPQIYNNWCGTASIQMMLDCPAVTGNNATLAAMLAIPDNPSSVAAGGVRPVATTNNGVVTSNPQAFIYGLTHGINTVNGVTYYNPYTPYGVGTDSYGVVAATNLLDNPTVNGQTGPAFGSHVYQGYNANYPALYTIVNGQPALNLLPVAAATRTIVNCMADYSVPAQLVVLGGAHSEIANGAETVGAPGAGQNYQLNYVQISDPWTGYAFNRLAVGDVASTNGTIGDGFNTWMRYGYDQLGPGQGYTILLPNGNIVQNARLGAWFNYFNVSSAQASPGFTQPGYKFTVEPQGPESLDTGDPAYDGSLPAPPPLLGSQETVGQADSAAISDLAADSTLANEPGLHGGSFDMADEMLIQMPGDTSGMGDWLVPYDGSGGTNDVTGALMIDSDTGVIDEATWINPAQDGISSMTLAGIDEWAEGQEPGGAEPDDNAIPTPEPGTLSLLAIAGLVAPVGYAVRRRRLATRKA